jgi:hypothetical protein
MIDC